MKKKILKKKFGKKKFGKKKIGKKIFGKKNKKNEPSLLTNGCSEPELWLTEAQPIGRERGRG